MIERHIQQIFPFPYVSAIPDHLLTLLAEVRQVATTLKTAMAERKGDCNGSCGLVKLETKLLAAIRMESTARESNVNASQLTIDGLVAAVDEQNLTLSNMEKRLGKFDTIIHFHALSFCQSF